MTSVHCVVSRAFVYAYLPSGPHSKKLNMKRFGEYFHRDVPGFSFSQKRNLHSEMMGLYSLSLLEELCEKVSDLGLIHEITVKGKTSSKLGLQTRQFSFLLVV